MISNRIRKALSLSLILLMQLTWVAGRAVTRTQYSEFRMQDVGFKTSDSNIEVPERDSESEVRNKAAVSTRAVPYSSIRNSKPDAEPFPTPLQGNRNPLSPPPKEVSTGFDPTKDLWPVQNTGAKRTKDTAVTRISGEDGSCQGIIESALLYWQQTNADPSRQRLADAFKLATQPFLEAVTQNAQRISQTGFNDVRRRENPKDSSAPRTEYNDLVVKIGQRYRTSFVGDQVFADLNRTRQPQVLTLEASTLYPGTHAVAVYKAVRYDDRTEFWVADPNYPPGNKQGIAPDSRKLIFKRDGTWAPYDGYRSVAMRVDPRRGRTTEDPIRNQNQFQKLLEAAKLGQVFPVQDPGPADVRSPGSRLVNDEDLRAEQLQKIDQVVKGVRSSWNNDNPNGVKIKIDDGMLLKVLTSGTEEENASRLDSLTEQLANAASQSDNTRILASFTNEIKLRFRSNKNLRGVDNLVVVSLKSLVNGAEAHAGNLDALPVEIRTLGGMTRIVGFVMDPSGADISLIGQRQPGSPPVELDDLIVGLSSVWRDGETPLVSLDPNADDFEGPQKVRVQGVPRNSGFARTMIDADYIMKKVMGGVETVNSSGFVNFKQILTRDRGTESMNRFWLYPIQPQSGDIQVSTDGKAALFMSGVQVLSEQLLRTQEGLIGSGHTIGAAEEAAVNFSKHYKDIESQMAIYKRLQTLFDIVLLSRIWQQMKIDSPLLNRLAALPFKQVDMPDSFPAVTIKVYETDDRVFMLSGGVQVNIGAGPRKWLVVDDPDMDALRKRIKSASASPSIAVSYSDLSIKVSEPDYQQRDTSSLAITTLMGRLNSGDAEGALTEASKLVQADPYDANALALRAFVNFCRNDLKGARADALNARDLGADEPAVINLSSIVLFQTYVLEGKPDLAMEAIDLSIKTDPTSVRSRILRAQALVQLERPAEARTELIKATQLDPTSAMALARLGMLELSEGWTTKGRKLITKAYAMSKTLDEDGPEIKVALAFAEMATAGMGNVHSQLAAATKLANEALANPACDPESALQALIVLLGSAMIDEKWDEVETYMARARKLAPFTPELFTFAAEGALEAKRLDLARKYLSEAEHINPGHPAVKALRLKIPQ
jgi:Flp pilus assembly protein TadD